MVGPKTGPGSNPEGLERAVFGQVSKVTKKKKPWQEHSGKILIVIIKLVLQPLFTASIKRSTSSLLLKK
jgi:hypothetical protein